MLLLLSEAQPKNERIAPPPQKNRNYLFIAMYDVLLKRPNKAKMPPLNIHCVLCNK
jgi:S-ribosylhomocysteine lyase LuxS involved in autoinducer biosynthesis